MTEDTQQDCVECDLVAAPDCPKCLIIVDNGVEVFRISCSNCSIDPAPEKALEILREKLKEDGYGKI